MEARLGVLRNLIWVGTGLAIVLIGVILTSQLFILMWLPKQPSPALIALLQTIQTGFVGALMTLVGALGGGITAYFSFRSAKETAGDETPAAP